MNTLKNRNVIIVGLLLILVAIFNIIHLYNDVKTLEQFQGINLSLTNIIKGFFISGAVINPTFLTLSIIGLCMPNKSGWVLSNNFFFYIFTKAAIILFPLENTEWYYYLLLIIALLPVLLMSNERVITLYQIKKSQRLTVMLAAILLGLSYTFIFEYFNLNYSLSTSELMEKLGV
ncbi:hypothetical protein [Labilibacter marinus]|uniref:hypothetical protein n=1 Tax=Labilibacter marinus TaxID=1477105 RepID=UPI000832ADCB|nr:hypothetical protein [Labilibacter marinus]